MSLTNEQIKSILDDAPDGATQYNTHRHGFKYWSIKIDFATHKLSDLAEILALRERVERLEQGNDLVIREVWHIVEPETMEQGK